MCSDSMLKILNDDYSRWLAPTEGSRGRLKNSRTSAASPKRGPESGKILKRQIYRLDRQLLRALNGTSICTILVKLPISRVLVWLLASAIVNPKQVLSAGCPVANQRALRRWLTVGVCKRARITCDCLLVDVSTRRDLWSHMTDHFACD
jgi:hypothetical protein